MGNQEIFTGSSTMLDDEGLRALDKAGKRRRAIRNNDVFGEVLLLRIKAVGHGTAGAFILVVPEVAAPCGTLGCTDTRPAVYPENERLYYYISGAE